MGMIAASATADNTRESPPGVKNLKITLASRSTDQKDRAAGWHDYLIEWSCGACGERHAETMHGRADEIRAHYTRRGHEACLNQEFSLACEECQSPGEYLCVGCDRFLCREDYVRHICTGQGTGGVE